MLGANLGLLLYGEVSVMACFNNGSFIWICSDLFIWPIVGALVWYFRFFFLEDFGKPHALVVRHRDVGTASIGSPFPIHDFSPF